MDSALAALLEPVWNAVLAFTPFRELLPNWDAFMATVEAARRALDAAPMGKQACKRSLPKRRCRSRQLI
jgi:hypothetical protein